MKAMLEILTQNIHPLTDFLRNHKTHIEHLKTSRKPEVLTVNGRAELVVIHAEVYEVIVEQLDELSRLKAIQAGIEDAERGEVIDSGEAKQRLKQRYGLSS